jgi:hypothetical protein
VEETTKIGFFKRIKYSIFNVENYKIFAGEKFSKAMKYLLKIIVIATIALSIASTVQLGKEISKLTNYIENEFPDFTYTDDNTLEVSQIVNAYDKEYDAKLIVDTSSEVSDETLEAYKSEAKQSGYSVILLNDKLIYIIDGTDQEITYESIASTLGIDGAITKSEFIENYFNTNTKTQMYAVIWIYAFISIFLMNFLTLVEDILIVGVFGWIAAKFTKVALKFSQTMSLAIYALTLSIILSTAYAVINTFCNFEIQYFSILYMIIAYIYIVASIMIMKDEINKTAGEAVTVEGQVIKTPDEEEKIEEKPKKKEKKQKEPKNQEDKKDENKEELPIEEEQKPEHKTRKPKVKADENEVIETKTHKTTEHKSNKTAEPIEHKTRTRKTKKEE